MGQVESTRDFGLCPGSVKIGGKGALNFLSFTCKMSIIMACPYKVIEVLSGMMKQENIYYAAITLHTYHIIILIQHASFALITILSGVYTIK